MVQRRLLLYKENHIYSIYNIKKFNYKKIIFFLLSFFYGAPAPYIADVIERYCSFVKGFINIAEFKCSFMACYNAPFFTSMLMLVRICVSLFYTIFCKFFSSKLVTILHATFADGCTREELIIYNT